LSELHLSYESAKPYMLDGLGDGPSDSSEAAYRQFLVEKMRFGIPTAAQSQAGLSKDRSTIVYNDHITLLGVPEEAYRYMLGSRSAIEWIMERYQVKVDKASKIRNDPNDWSREVGDPRYILDLLARIVTVSLETMAICRCSAGSRDPPDTGEHLTAPKKPGSAHRFVTWISSGPLACD
jgi:predicted helicase